jgi:cytochrome c-type biogenesis protein
MASGSELTAGGFVLAAVAGAASFLSPCVLPLVPGYLSFISGVSVEGLRVNTRRVVVSAAAFVSGFSLMFAAVGAGAAFLGGFVRENQRLLQIVAGALLVLLGVVISGLVPLGFLARERRVLRFRPVHSLLGAFVTGVAFALGWTPCVGPILASILTLAASGRDPLGGALLLLVYGLGLGVPFLLVGLFFTKAVGAFSWVKRHFRVIQIVSGALLAVYGLLLIGGQFTWLSAQLGRLELPWF